MQSGSEKRPPVGERIADFVQKYRKPILVSAVLAVLVLIGSVVTLVVLDVRRGRAIAAVEELGVRYEALRDLVLPPLPAGGDAEGEGDENGVPADAAEPGPVGYGEPDDAVYPERDGLAGRDVEGEIAELFADLRTFASRNSGYAGGRAWSMLGSLYGRMGEWAEAEAAWLAASGATRRFYMSPIALFNAAAAAEEQGGRENLERAMYHYAASISAPAGFFAAPRAQFSIGRILETLGDYPAAIQAYRDVIFGWPHDERWTNFAHSRIIALETMDQRPGPDERVERPPVEDTVTWADMPLFNGDAVFADTAAEDFAVRPQTFDGFEFPVLTEPFVPETWGAETP